MNPQSILLDYYLGLSRDFHRLFLELLEAYNRDTVHHLRVTMKKLQAFYRFLQATEPTFSAQEAQRAFGDLYEIAGSVRDIQVERLLLRQRVHLEPVIQAWFHREETAFREGLQRYALEHTLIPIRAIELQAQATLMYRPTDSLLDRFELFLQRRFRKIKRMASDTSPERLHLLRKRLKQLFFNIHMLQLLLPAEKLPKKSLKALDNFQKTLGDWHDLDFMQHILTEEPHLCPAKARHKIQRDAQKATAKTLEALQILPEVLEHLEIAVMELLQKVRQAFLQSV